MSETTPTPFADAPRRRNPVSPNNLYTSADPSVNVSLPKPSRPHLVGAEAAAKQVEIMTGSRDTVVRLCAIHKPSKSVIEKAGTFAALLPEFIKLAEGGSNIYIRAQPTRPELLDNVKATDSDVIGMRCLYADGDETALPTSWHVEPNFVLHQPDTGRWWAGWRITDGQVEDIRDMVARIARHYGSDLQVINESRLIRAACFPRWKENPVTKAWERFAPYELEVCNPTPTELWMHQGLAPLPPRTVIDRSRLNDDDVISEKRLRDLLAFIDPFNRDDWRNSIFAIRDAKVLRPNLERLEPDEVLTLCDQHASGALWAEHPGPKLPRCDVGNYVDPSDTEKLFYGPRGNGAQVRLGTVVHTAQAHANKQGKVVPAETCRPGAAELGLAAVRPGAAKPGLGESTADDDMWIAPLCDIKTTPAPWIIEGLIGAKNIGFLSGGQGSLKTQDALMAAVCCITGRDYYGHKVLKTGPVLYLALEDDASTKTRLAAVCDGVGLTSEERAGVDAWFFAKKVDAGVKFPRDLEKMMRAVAWIKQKTEHEVVLIALDTFRELLTGTVNDEKDVSPVIDTAKELARPGPAVMMIGHVSAEGAKQPLEQRRPKGITDIEDRSDFIIMKEADAHGGTAAFYTLKVKNGAAKRRFDLTVRPGLGGFPVQSLAASGAARSDMQPQGRKARPAGGGKSKHAPSNPFEDERTAKVAVSVLQKERHKAHRTTAVVEMMMQEAHFDIEAKSLGERIKRLSRNKDCPLNKMFRPAASTDQAWRYYDHSEAGAGPFTVSGQSDRAARTGFTMHPDMSTAGTA